MSVGSEQMLFVGSYGPPDDATIHICTLDESSGALRVVQRTAGVTNPSFLAVSLDGSHLYAVSETGLGNDGTLGSVHAFRIVGNGDAVELHPLNQQSSAGDHPCHLCIDRSGRWLAVSNYGSGSVAVLPVGPEGGLGHVASVVQHEGSGPNPDRQEGPHAHATIFAPDGRFLIAADLGIDRLLISAFDEVSGSIQPHGEVRTRPGAGPRHLAFHHDGSHLFVVNELDNTLTLYEWAADAGTLGELVTVPTVPPGAQDSIAADIRVAADGRHAYVSNRGHDSVAVFAFDDGRLTPLGVRPCGGSWPRGLGLTPDGRFLLAANQHTDNVVVVSLVADGSDVGGPVMCLPIANPTCVAFAARADSSP